MQLLLTSYRLPSPQVIPEIFKKEIRGMRLAVVPNAKDYYIERAKQFKMRQKTDYLAGIGFAPTVIDLLKIDSNEHAFNDFDALWVSGGNTFCLRYAMQKSGFDVHLPRLLDKGLLYIGESAGACVLGPTLRGLESADEPSFAKETLWDGLGVLKEHILPHIDNEWMQEDITFARAAFAGQPTIELTDSQMYVYDNFQGHIIDAAS